MVLFHKFLNIYVCVSSHRRDEMGWKFYIELDKVWKTFYKCDQSLLQTNFVEVW